MNALPELELEVELELDALLSFFLTTVVYSTSSISPGITRV